MVAGSRRAPDFTRRRGISRNNLPSHCVNLNGGTSLATSIAGLSASTCCRKRIQVLRMPVSPSGRRFRCGPVAAARVRNTVSASGNGMLPTKWTIGLCAGAALIAALSPQLDRNPLDLVERNLIAAAVIELGGARTFMQGHALNVFKRAARLE